MKKTLLLLLSFLSFLSFFISIGQNYDENCIIIKISTSYRSTCSNDFINIPSFITFTEQNDITSIDRMFKNIPINHDLSLKSDISLLYKLKYEGNDILNTIKKINNLSEIEYAELEYKNFLLDTTNDPLSDSVTGVQPGLKMHKIYEAWNITKGDSNILIAVSDAGTTPTHPDLIDNIYKNLNDTIDGIDNDNDGLVDNYIGWDFSEDNNDPSELLGYHGTAVCGVAGAKTNNNIGLASIGYNSKIVPLKCSEDANPNGVNTGYDAVQFAATKQYDILNLSWGCQNCYSQASQDIINNAVLDNNVIIISAAGNQEKEVEYYPASYDNVLSVSSINTNYIKPNFRSWHYYVDLVTQGAVVKSTHSNGGYTNSWGTSFSAPMVASAAALVKDVFPNYDAVQIMEQLRVTTDSIYHFAGNLPYIDKLGTGSMNVLNAVTNITTPSIRNVKNYENETYFGRNGDTIYIHGEFVNYLNSSVNLSIELSTPSNYISVINNFYQANVINTYDTLTNNANSFSFVISDSTPTLTEIWLKFSYNDGVYKDFQYKKIVINPDFIHINENEISTTANSTGNIGFTSPNRDYGNGVIYNSTQLLYEAGLLISCKINDTIKVSDNLRSSPNVINQDFIAENRIKQIDPLGFSDFKATTTFRDTLADSLNNVGVRIVSNFYAWNNAPNDKYFIVEYEITNRNPDTLKDVYVGIFADWDLLNLYANKAGWSFNEGFGYAKTNNNSIYAGIKPLWPYYGSYYAIDNAANNSIGIYDGFDDIEKYKALSLVNEKISAGIIPTDISHTVGMNIGNLAPNETKTTAFALMVGDSLQDLINSSISAQTKYGNQIIFNGPSPNAFDTITCEGTETEIRVQGGENYLLFGGINDFLVLDDSLPLTTPIINDTTIFYVAYPNGDFPGVKTPVTVYSYLPEVDFWLEPDTLYLDDRNYTYPHNISPYYSDIEWDLGNGVQTTSFNPSATYSDSGTYYVTLFLTDSNNCFNYLSLPLVVIEGSNLENSNSEKIKVQVYPNPTKNQLFISNLSKIESRINLVDVKGNLLMDFKTSQKSTIIDFEHLPFGAYQLIINNQQFKIIKN